MNTEVIRILLVEDDEEDYLLTQDALDDISGNRYILFWAATFDEGLEAILRDEHDIYLVDYRLGKEDGLHLLSAAIDHGIDTPFILLTGHADRELDIEAMKSGASDFLVKGQITAEALDRSIRYSIELNKTVRQLRKSQLQIAKEKAATQTYLDMAGSIILVIKMDETVQLVNQEGATILGYPEKEIIGKNWFDHFIPPEDRAGIKELFYDVVHGKLAHIEYFENKILTATGEERLIRWYNRVLRNDDGEVIATISSGTDITTQREAALLLEASEKRFRQIVEKLPAGAIIVQDEQISLNQAAEKLTGYKTKELSDIARWFDTMYEKEEGQKARKQYEEDKEKGFPKARTICLKRKNGQACWVNFQGYLFEKGVAWLMNDITQSRLAEQVLKENREKLENYAEKLEQEVALQTAELALSQTKLIEAHKLAKIGYWEINLEKDELKLNWSKECFQLFDIDYQSVEDKRYFLQYVDPEDRERVLNMTKESLQKGKDIITGFRIMTPKGKEKFIHMELKCLRDGEGRLEKIFSVIQDVSEQKNAELKLAQSLQKERELGELKSRFVSMASHEFRTPLSAILSSADLIRMYKDKEQTDKMSKHIKRIKSSVNNLTSILNDFLSLEKLESGKLHYLPERVEITPYIEEVIDELKPIAEENQEIRHQHTGPTAISIDRHLVKNILINLLSNAIKYSPDGSPVDVMSQVDDQQVLIHVRDYGIGIPEEDQKYMFTRFFRATNASNIKGTGLGLTIVKRYLDMMDGEIGFVSKAGENTTFTISIPQQQ